MLTPNDFGDKWLLSKIAEGDEDAFRKIFLKYAPFLQSRLKRIINTQFEQEDLIQETFLRVWLHRDQLPDIKNWQAWLLKICYNRAFNHLRDQRLREKEREKLQINSHKNETEESVDLSNLKGIIDETILDLPPQQKKVYLMNRVQGMQIAEISDHLSISRQTVKNHLGIALKSIRIALERHGYLFWTTPLMIIWNFF